jgi:16S rRNA (cytosine967-C5)-methyltransferase
VNDAVELVRRAGNASAASFVNAVMRRITREPGTVPETASTPPWILQRWVRRYGAQTAETIAHASLNPPERFIRVGSKTPPEGAVPTGVPGCYLLESGDPAPFRFQDIGSQAVIPLLDLQPNQTFLDLCAAPGNKTAQALETPLHAIACDVHLSRARTLKVLGIPLVILNAQTPLPFSAAFDRILVDAPCSGTGTLARNPEIKARITEADSQDLQRRQAAILRNALAALKPGGLLVYSTCSLEREENEGVIEACGVTPVKTMQRIPGRDPGDGFFAAVITR